MSATLRSLAAHLAQPTGLVRLALHQQEQRARAEALAFDEQMQRTAAALRSPRHHEETPMHDDCGCRPDGTYTCPTGPHKIDEPTLAARYIPNRAERRRRGARGPLLNTAVTREAAARTGLRPSEVSSLYVQQERAGG